MTDRVPLGRDVGAGRALSVRCGTCGALPGCDCMVRAYDGRDGPKPARPTNRPHVARRSFAVALARWNGEKLSVDESRLADRML